MNFDYLSTSTEQWNTEPSIWEMQTRELGGINPELITQAAHAGLKPKLLERNIIDKANQINISSHSWSSNLTQALPHDHISATRPPGLKPRVVSDSAIIVGQPYGNCDPTSQGLPHKQRYQRTLSVGCQPFSNHQGLEPDLVNSAHYAPGTTAKISLGSSESLEDPTGTASGLGYDGTKPIAYVQVNDPQRYLSQSTYNIPGFRSHNTSSQGHSTSQTHSNVDWTCSQPGGQPQLTDKVAYSQKFATHGQIMNQPPVHALAPDPYSYPSSQIISSFKAGLEHQQESAIKPEGWLDNRAKGQVPDQHQSAKTYCDTSIQTKQVHEPQLPNRSRNGSRILSATKIVAHTGRVSVHPMMHTQSMAVSSPTTGLNLASTRELQEVMTQSTLGNTSAPNFDTVNYSDRDPIHYPTYTHHSPKRSSFNRSLLDCCQPSASSNRSSHYDTHRSRNPPASIAGNEFQSTSVVVPVPRRSFNFGAFLTPDPPYQTPNIDLPRRPGTSPPQQSSVPNGRCLLAPNTGRRQSEVTWQSYSSQFDRVQFPPVPSCNPRSRNDIPEKHTHAPPISAAPQTQPSVQAQDPREDICAIATYGSISTQSIDSRPLPISACPPQFLVQRPSASAIREGLGVRRPGESHGCTPTSSTLRRKRSVQQYHTRQNKSNPGQVSQKPKVHTQSAAPATQSEDAKEKINQQPQAPAQAPSSEYFTQIASSTAEVQGTGRRPVTKRRYSHSNPGDTSGAKKRKAVNNGPEVINTQTDILVPYNQHQQQNSSAADHDCIHFDVNTWRDGDVIKQAVQQSNLAGSNTQAQPEGGDRRFMMPLPGEPTGVASEKTGENLLSSEPSQVPYNSSGTAPPVAAESWLPAFQHVGRSEQTSNIPFMNWDPSNVSLDQTTAFKLEVAAESRGPEQYVAAFDKPERPAPDAPTQLFPLVSTMPYNFEIEQFLADCYGQGMGPVFA